MSSAMTLTHRLTLDILGSLIDNSESVMDTDPSEVGFTCDEYVSYLDDLWDALNTDATDDPEGMWTKYRELKESVGTKLKDYVGSQIEYHQECGWSDEPILTDIRRAQEPRLSEMKTTVLESLYEEASWYGAVSSQGAKDDTEEFARAKHLRDSFEAILDEFIRQM